MNLVPCQYRIQHSVQVPHCFHCLFTKRLQRLCNRLKLDVIFVFQMALLKQERLSDLYSSPHNTQLNKIPPKEQKVSRREFYLKFLYFFGRASLYNLVNKSKQVPILFNIFIYFSSLHVSGIPVPIIRRKLLYLCDTGICHSVWMVSGLLVGFNPTSRPDSTHTE